MTNDMESIGTVELVSSEVSGHLGPDGKFVYGEPVATPKADEQPVEVFTQSDEDAIQG